MEKGGQARLLFRLQRTKLEFTVCQKVFDDYASKVETIRREIRAGPITSLRQSGQARPDFTATETPREIYFSPRWKFPARDRIRENFSQEDRWFWFPTRSFIRFIRFSLSHPCFPIDRTINDDLWSFKIEFHARRRDVFNLFGIVVLVQKKRDHPRQWKGEIRKKLWFRE